MAFDPITGIIDLVKVGIDRFVPKKMDEKDKLALAQNMQQFIVTEASKTNSDFRSFILGYEGAAKDVPKVIVILRALIRPCFTMLVGYLDWMYFAGTVTDWGPEAISLLKAINIIVLMFWFGERAVKNSGIIEMLTKKNVK